MTFADQDGMALAGWTGLLRVPTAEIRKDLALAIAWQDGGDLPLRYAVTQRANRHLVLSVPIWSWLEVGIGMLQVPGWVDPLVPALPEGAVHRTSHLKIRSPWTPLGWSIAAGVFDPLSANGVVGLEGTRYGMGTAYAVGTRQFGETRWTLGWAVGDAWRPGRAPAPWWPGPMAGIEHPVPLPGDLAPVRLLADWNGRSLWGGLRWSPFSSVTLQLGGGDGALAVSFVGRAPL